MCDKECHEYSPKVVHSYASIPNDIWSLGVILVNLTCGRNPWKKASTEDATYQAFLSDPNFLTSILPISPELNAILTRIFVRVPEHRVSIKELRSLILRCPRFTMHSGLPMPSLERISHLNKALKCIVTSSSAATPLTPPQSPPMDPMHLPSPASLSPSGSSVDSVSACSTPPSLSLVLDQPSPLWPAKVIHQQPMIIHGSRHVIPRSLPGRPLCFFTTQSSIKAF